MADGVCGCVFAVCVVQQHMLQVWIRNWIQTCLSSCRTCDRFVCLSVCMTIQLLLWMKTNNPFGLIISNTIGPFIQSTATPFARPFILAWSEIFLLFFFSLEISHNKGKGKRNRNCSQQKRSIALWKLTLSGQFRHDLWINSDLTKL